MKTPLLEVNQPGFPRKAVERRCGFLQGKPNRWSKGSKREGPLLVKKSAELLKTRFRQITAQLHWEASQ
jgi:hypothetical protein